MGGVPNLVAAQSDSPRSWNRCGRRGVSVIYVNIEGESAWTEDEVQEAYELDVSTYPDTTGTYEGWLEEQLDLGLTTSDIEDHLDEIHPK
jgi:hypothetical protein